MKNRFLLSFSIIWFNNAKKIASQNNYSLQRRKVAVFFKIYNLIFHVPPPTRFEILILLLLSWLCGYSLYAVFMETLRETIWFNAMSGMWKRKIYCWDHAVSITHGFSQNNYFSLNFKGKDHWRQSPIPGLDSIHPHPLHVFFFHVLKNSIFCAFVK